MVYDTNGCSAPYGSPIVIANPPLLTVSATGSAQVSCNNGTDGTITITATGGTGAYTFTLNGTTTQSSNVFSGLGAGTYSINVVDANGCSATAPSISTSLIIFPLSGRIYNMQHKHLRMKPWLRPMDAQSYILFQTLDNHAVSCVLA